MANIWQILLRFLYIDLTLPSPAQNFPHAPKPEKQKRGRNTLRDGVINKQNVSENDIVAKDRKREDNRRRDQRNGARRTEWVWIRTLQRKKPQRKPLWPKHPSSSCYCDGKRLLTSPADVQPASWAGLARVGQRRFGIYMNIPIQVLEWSFN